jgi:glycosyltransferase involved in cell wall biosynthesis
MNTNEVFLTVVIPCLNEEVCLPNLLNDLKYQSFTNFSLTIVDGKSEDKTIEKARLYQNHFRSFNIITSNKRHVGHQRNLGAKASNTEWVVFLDADDRIPKYFLQGIKYRMESTNLEIFTSYIEAETQHTKDQAFAILANLFTEIQISTKNPYMLESMLCVKRQPFLELGGFDESLGWGEGSDLARRALKKKVRVGIVRDPKYIFSLRRLRKQGTLVSARNVATIELARLRHIKLPKEVTSYLYPMEGGSYFKSLDKKSASRLSEVVKKIYESKSITTVRKKTGFLNRLLRLKK